MSTKKLVIDWQQLALNLRKHGSLTARSVKMGYCHSYLNQLARAQIFEPRFSIGLELLDLHLDLCGQQLTEKLKRG